MSESQSSRNEQSALLPCPFCGHKVDLSDMDTLYPNGTLWRFNSELGMRTYHGFNDRQDGDSMCYVMNCPSQAGGCGAEVNGDSREEAIAAWNRRYAQSESVSSAESKRRRDVMTNEVANFLEEFSKNGYLPELSARALIAYVRGETEEIAFDE